MHAGIDALFVFFTVAIAWTALLPALAVLGVAAVVLGVRAHGRTKTTDRHNYGEAA